MESKLSVIGKLNSMITLCLRRFTHDWTPLKLVQTSTRDKCKGASCSLAVVARFGSNLHPHHWKNGFVISVLCLCHPNRKGGASKTRK